MKRLCITLVGCLFASVPAWPETGKLATGTLAAGSRAADAPASGPSAPTMQLTETQLQFRTVHAIERNQLDQALHLALAILEADPEDSFGHMAMATVLLRGGNPDQARLAARKAYQTAGTPRQKHEAARVAALANARQDRFLPAQVWMRRAHQSAPDEVTRQRSAQEFRTVRNRARLNFQLSGSLSPSSNVNNGAADRFNVVDGLPVVGILPPSSLALSGLVGTFGGQLSYRLHETTTTQTRLTAGGQIKRVWLSREARDDAPDAENSDFGSTYGEVGLLHFHNLPQKSGTISLGATLGQAWNGGERSYNVGGARIGYHVGLSATTSLSVNGYYQRRFEDAQDLPDVETFGGKLTLGHALGNGDHLALSLSQTTAQSKNPQSRSLARGVEVSYRRAKPIGPVSLSVSAGISETHYPDYSILSFPVEGGRNDTRQTARINLKVDQMTYMGFTPVVTLASEKTQSNVSRFETDELSLSIGIRSSF
ncbi:surface lipoprotein assembly modifier [Phaeobacter sp. J2-8]|uniref:surface lipoprotein assembly modifier n=1 Tax=Phaeobacter sp. J2-8 TaxID=2931394 RepID=UPI001FD4C9BD|nr:surface lipoprotein assembly modifier [Phaeobacter sp. J2-8]MCJ7871852.1 surface lipoprotein assembly modifier [Phaeobacter sp. J2-8]